MDIPQPNENEPTPERQIINKVQQLHEEFLEKVPMYGRSIWRPEDALQLKQGSCMAELLYVVGGLLADQRVNEEDITIGFSKEHGQQQPGGPEAKSSKNYTHGTLLLTTPVHTTLTFDFRVNRRDEDVQFQRLTEDQLDIDKTHLLPLGAAIEVYGQIDGMPNPTVEELIALHRPDQTATKLTFDEDF